MAAGAVVAAALGVIGLSSAAPSGAATGAATPYYLALGGSGSVGVQPTAADPSGQPTDEGYANDLALEARSLWPGLQLVELGCPGETTATFISGLDRCHKGDGSQLGDLTAFLHSHPDTALITVDLGFNDIRTCLRGLAVDRQCLDTALDAMKTRLEQIVHDIRSEAPRDARIVGIGHYDPNLGRWMHSHQSAMPSIDAFAQLNDALDAAYGAEGVPVADVSKAFDTSDSQPSLDGSLGKLPVDVARVCALTWECSPPPYGPNMHPNEKGYALIARSIMDVLGSR